MKVCSSESERLQIVLELVIELCASEDTGCHDHACPRRVVYGRMLDVSIMLVQDVLSIVTCLFQFK